MGKGLKIDSCAVRVSKRTKAALVAGVSDLMRASGQVAHVGDLVDELVAVHLPTLVASRIATLSPTNGAMPPAINAAPAPMAHKTGGGGR